MEDPNSFEKVHSAQLHCTAQLWHYSIQAAFLSKQSTHTCASQHHVFCRSHRLQSLPRQQSPSRWSSQHTMKRIDCQSPWRISLGKVAWLDAHGHNVLHRCCDSTLQPNTMIRLMHVSHRYLSHRRDTKDANFTYEIIIVDDGSRDNTSGCARQLQTCILVLLTCCCCSALHMPMPQLKARCPVTILSVLCLLPQLSCCK